MPIPCAIDSEQYLIGAVVSDNLEPPALVPSDFLEPKHQDIWSVCLFLKSKEIELNEISVGNELRNRNINLTGYLNDLTTQVFGKRFSSYWEESIRKSAQLRRLNALGAEIQQHTQNPNAEPEQLLAFLEGTAKTFGLKKKSGLEEMQLNTLDEFNRADDHNEVIGKFRWLCKGGSMLLVSQSGVGKSSFTMQFIISLCIKYPKGFFGIEAKRPLRVVMLQAENDIGDVAEAYQDITKGMFISDSDKELLKENFRIFRDTESVGQEFINRMKELIVLHRADVFVVDPLLSFAGIEVADQKQMTEFLRHGVARVLEETGAVLIAVHHTTKPRSSKDKEGQTAADLAYSGAGASELVNYVREVGVLQRCQGEEPIFKFSLTKRRNRAGMKDNNGEFSPEIYVRHARQNNAIRWEYSPAPEAQPEESSSVGSQTPSKSLKKVPQGRFNA